MLVQRCDGNPSLKTHGVGSKIDGDVPCAANVRAAVGEGARAKCGS